MMILKGKVALVTGGSRGIGRAVALRLAGDGALVAVHYGSNLAAVTETVRAIEETGGTAFPVQARLDQPGGELEKMFAVLDKQLVERTGDAHFDILVNNAGVDRSGTIEDITPEVFDHLFGTNVKGLFFLTQNALSRIRDNGRIINISSGLARVTRPDKVVYSMAKAAVDKLTKILALQMGPRGITVNSVAPGAMDTDMNASWLRGNEAAAATVSQRTALGRVGQTRDIADIVAFLASDGAGWITANWIDATGGQSL